MITIRKHRCTQQFLHGRCQVCIVIEALNHCVLLHAGPANDHRNTANRLIRGAMLSVNTELSKVFAVIRCDNDRKIVIIQTILLQPINNLTDVIICVFYTVIIQIQKVLCLFQSCQLTGVLWPLRKRIIIPHVDLVCAVGSDVQQVLFKGLLVDPVIRKRRIRKLARIICRCTIRCMRIPVMHMHHPVILLAVSLQPIQNMRSYHLCGLTASPAYIVAFIETGIKPPCTVTFCKGREGNRMHSGSSKLHEQSVLRHVIRKASGGSLQTHIRSCTAMPYNSVMNSILSADHGCSGRKARCIRAVIIIEPHSLLCNFIHYRCGISAIAITAHMIRPQRINVKQ